MVIKTLIFLFIQNLNQSKIVIRYFHLRNISYNKNFSFNKKVQIKENLLFIA